METVVGQIEIRFEASERPENRSLLPRNPLVPPMRLLVGALDHSEVPGPSGDHLPTIPAEPEDFDEGTVAHGAESKNAASC